MASVEAEASRDERSSAGGVVYDGFISYSHAADDLLAPRLQAGLQRFAKPWWKRRALRIFRDESSLSANPHLWSSITDALDQSGWFVLLLSPEAAESPWVNNEVEYWLEHKTADKIIPVLTDGDFTWFDDDFISDAAPPALQGAFSDEPRWVDLRFARTEEQLDLKNPTFSAAVADIASAIRGVPKDELESEEVLQHRRTTRTAWAAGVALVALLVLAIAAAVFALDQRNEAEHLAASEAVAREEADANAAEAAENAEEAQRNEALAEEQAQIARARELGAAAIEVVDSDPGLARLLALEAVDLTGLTADQPSSVVNALWQSLLTDRLVDVFETGRSGFTTAALSNDGTLLVISSENGRAVDAYSVPDGEYLWGYADQDAVVFSIPRISPDGTQVATAASFRPPDPEEPADGDEDRVPSHVIVLEAASGSVVQVIEYPSCFSAGPWDWSPDGQDLTVSNGPEPCPRDEAPDGFWIEVFDTTTWQPETVIASEGFGVMARFDDAGRLYLLKIDAPTTVHEPPDYEEVAVLEEAIGYGDVSPDGSRVSAMPSDLIAPMLISTETGETVDVLTPMIARPSWPLGAEFSPDGQLVAVSNDGAEILVWHVETGQQAFRLPSGPADAALVSPDGRWLYSTHPDGVVKVWDLGAKTINTTVAGDLGDADFVNGNSFEVGDATGTFQALDFDGSCPPDPFCISFGVFDPATGEVLELNEGYYAYPFVENRIVYDFHNEIRTRTLATDQFTAIAGCVSTSEDPICDDTGEEYEPFGFFISVDGSELAFDDGVWEEAGRLRIVNPLTGETIEEIPGEPENSAIQTFSPEWVFSEGDAPDGDGMLSAVDRATGEILFEYELSAAIRNEEVSSSGRRFAAVLATGEVVVVNLGTWEVQSFEVDIGKVRGMAFGPGDTVIALADEDVVYFLDLELGLITQSIPIPGVSDLHWIDNETLVFGTRDGLWSTLSLNVGDLVEAARNPAVPRDFTPQECAFYNLDCSG